MIVTFLSENAVFKFLQRVVWTRSLKPGFYKHISISTQHTQRQCAFILFENYSDEPNYPHFTASVYVDKCLCLLTNENQALQCILGFTSIICREK